MANTKMTREWFKKARGDLLKAEYFLESNNEEFLDGAIYYCQQAIEKAFKSFLTNHNVRFKPTHDLTALAENAMQLAPSINIDLKTMDQITKYALMHRYPDARPIELTTLTFKVVKGHLDLAKTLLKTLSAKISAD